MNMNATIGLGKFKLYSSMMCIAVFGYAFYVSILGN